MITIQIFDFLHRLIPTRDYSVITSETCPELALRKLALKTAVGYVQNAISKSEFLVYENGERADNSELYYRLNVSPNPNQNSSELWQQVVYNLCFEGEALIIQHGKYLYCADSFSTDTKPLGKNVYNGVSVGGQSVNGKFTADNAFYFELHNENLARLVMAATEPYGKAFNTALKGFESKNARKYKYKLSQIKYGDNEFAEKFDSKIQNDLKAFVNAEKAVLPEYNGTDLQEFDSKSSSYSAGSADIATLRKEIFEVTTSVFKMPAAMLFGNITNVNDIVNQFLTFCVDPFADILSEGITRGAFSFEEWQKGGKVVCDTSCVSHIDVVAAAPNLDKLISSGILNQDEARRLIRYIELNTEESKAYHITKNYERI